ncbi:helix-turn-helix domain-containing protein [uncultured Muribaculum sp.]|uniref:winged helix-turn-helix transcriptional regulator n=1 Tax=uncultured Muribaculum sp. TaxID=1918613 RepID=UPI0025D23BA1|nr:helix-turn-helix domain-containing protein [uncultured Muribaculum sp.]
MAKKLDYEYCKAAPMLEWMGNKWALVVLLKVSENEPARFNELYRTIPAISEKVLSQVLRQLYTDGILDRQLYPDVPPRVEYSVSDFGKTLLPLVQNLITWGQENFDTIIKNRQDREIILNPPSRNSLQFVGSKFVAGSEID